MKKHRNTKGFSIALVFGSYGGFHIIIKHGTLRICLGWVALTFYSYDLENAVANLISNK